MRQPDGARCAVRRTERGAPDPLEEIMAYYATSTLVPADEVLFDVHGPGDLIAGEPAESEELAKTWVELLSQREAEIQGALDAGDTARAEAIWQEVEEEAR